MKTARHGRSAGPFIGFVMRSGDDYQVSLDSLAEVLRENRVAALLKVPQPIWKVLSVNLHSLLEKMLNRRNYFIYQ